MTSNTGRRHWIAAQYVLAESQLMSFKFLFLLTDIKSLSYLMKFHQRPLTIWAAACSHNLVLQRFTASLRLTSLHGLNNKNPNLWTNLIQDRAPQTENEHLCLLSIDKLRVKLQLCNIKSVVLHISHLEFKTGKVAIML